MPASDKLTAKALAAAQDRQLIAVIDVKGEPVAAKLPTGAELAPYAPYKQGHPRGRRTALGVIFHDAK